MIKTSLFKILKIAFAIILPSFVGLFCIWVASNYNVFGGFYFLGLIMSPFLMAVAAQMKLDINSYNNKSIINYYATYIIIFIAIGVIASIVSLLIQPTLVVYLIPIILLSLISYLLTLKSNIIRARNLSKLIKDISDSEKM